MSDKPFADEQQALPALYVALFDADVGSPNGARWTDETGDRLAADVKDALESMQTKVEMQQPDGTMKTISCMQTDGRRSPSLIWTAQAVGSLLELGFTPKAPCVKDHLDVIALSLDKSHWRDPYVDGLKEPWVIRARHMAWFLGCLAEFQPPERPIAKGATLPDLPEDGRDEAEVLAERSLAELIERAYEGLVGSPHKDTPARWISPRRANANGPGRDAPQLAWDEGWPDPEAGQGQQKLERRKNLLTTIYAVLSICRAERHGYRRHRDAWQAVLRDEQPASVLVQHLITQIRVEPAVDGPTVRLTGDWLEPWANAHTLPTSVIGLLALALVEYTRFLADIIKRDDPERRLVRGAFLKAQRLAESLLARPKFLDTSWSRGADAFFQKGAEGTPWFVPSCSVCLRAVLETGVADPTHPLVRDALDTLGLLAIDPAEGGWLDPTYHTGMGKDAYAKAVETVLSRRGHPQRLADPQEKWLQHAEMDIRLALARRPTPGEKGEWQATPASVYGAALALSAVRRAWSRADPRTLPGSARTPADASKPPPRLLGASAFDTIRIEGESPPFEVKLLRDDTSYAEETRLVHRGTHDLLRALPREGSASAGELQRTLRELRRKDGRPASPEGGEQTLDRPSAIESRIDKTNVFFGFQLIESMPAEHGREPRYRIGDSTELKIDEMP